MQLDLFTKEEETERKETVQHPVMVSLTYNEMMKKWDVLVIIGGFEKEEEATAAAMDLARLMEEEFGTQLLPPPVPDEGTMQ